MQHIYPTDYISYSNRTLLSLVWKFTANGSFSFTQSEGREVGEIREKKKVNKKGIKLDGEKENEREKNHEDRDKDEQVFEKEKEKERKRGREKDKKERKKERKT